MLRHGDDFVHFTKVRGNQMAEIRTMLDKRPKGKFSQGLSPEAQEAMQQVVEETKIEENARRGKRGSKGNVLFSDTVTIRTEILPPSRLGPSDAFPVSPRSRGAAGRRGSLLSERRGSLGVPSNDFDQVEIANKMANANKWQEDRRGSSSQLATEKCQNWLNAKHS